MSRRNQDDQIYSRDAIPTCAITHDIFFLEVESNCGHHFEDAAIREWINETIACPCCRTPISECKPVVDDKLARTLLVHPEFYEEVYFNFELFKKIIEKNELSTALGQRFITLLQHAENHLNEEGVIALLASIEEGRDALRKHFTIKIVDDEKHYYFGLSRISNESLEILVKDISIRSWLLMDAQAYFFTRESLSRKKIDKEESFFFEKMLLRHTLFCPKKRRKNNRSHSDLVNNLLKKLVCGDEDALKNSLKSAKNNPEKLRDLLMSVGAARDYSGRTISNVTLLQAATMLGDNEMVKIIKPYFRYIQEDVIEVKKQVADIFSTVSEQNQTASIYLLDNIYEAIDNAEECDINAALLKQNNYSALCNQALPDFRDDCKNLFFNELVFNPQYLLLALERYKEQFNTWLGSDELKSKKRDLCWRQVIGYFQRFLPANYAQVFAQGLYDVVESNHRVTRSFNFNDRPKCSFYPLSDEHIGLGFDYAISSDGPTPDMHKTDDQDYYLLEKLVLKKNSALQEIINGTVSLLSACSMM